MKHKRLIWVVVLAGLLLAASSAAISPKPAGRFPRERSELAPLTSASTSSPATPLAPAVPAGSMPNWRAIVQQHGPAVVGVTVAGLHRGGAGDLQLDPSDPLFQFLRGFAESFGLDSLDGALVVDVSPGSAALAAGMVAVKLGRAENDEQARTQRETDQPPGQLGLSLRALTADELARLHLRAGPRVERVRGAAARAEVQVGDVRLAVNGMAVWSADAGSGSSPLGAADFIDKYVFPGGELPHISLALRDMQAAGLEALDVECLRRHYARTLAHWAQNYEHHAEQIRSMVSETTFRVWRIYLAGCAHGFEQNWVSLHQVLACKAGAGDRFNPTPWSRAYMYS